MLLYELYLREKDALFNEMQKQTAVEGLIKTVNKYLAKLTDLNGEYISGLTRPQAKIALSILGIYKDHFRKLEDQIDRITHPVSERAGHVYSPRPTKKQQRRIPDSNTLAGIGVSTLVAAFLTNPLVAIPAGSLAGLFAAIALLETKSSSPISAQGEGHASTIHSHHFPLDYSAFMSNLEQLFRTVDDVLEEHNSLTEAARPQPALPKLEDHTRILEFIQDLLGWYQRQKSEFPDAVGNALELRLEEQLPDLFSEYRIKISYFLPETGDRDMKLFDFEDEVGEKRLSKPLMVRPALLKEGEVLLRGRVIEPRVQWKMKP